MKLQPPVNNSVFSSEGRSSALRKVFALVACVRCGRQLDVTPSHIGGAVSCACGAVTKIGERLPAGMPEVAVRHVFGRRASNRLVAISGILGLATTLVVGVIWTAIRDDLPPTTAARFETSGVATPVTAVSLSRFVGSPPKRRGKRRKLEITIEQIRELRQEQDLRAALVTARLWDGALVEQGVPATDSLRKALADVIQDIVAKLTEPPMLPADVTAELRRMMHELRSAIDGEQISHGRELLRSAEDLIKSHPDTLGPYARNLAVLKAKLDEVDRLLAQVPRIKALLSEARRLAQSDVTAARECEAWAKFLAFHTPLTPVERESLENLVTDLKPVLLLGRGRRAVEDAARCERVGDVETRDLLVAEARQLLPGLDESVVVPLLRQAERSAKSTILARSGSPFGKSVAFRRSYEAALESFSAGRPGEAIHAADEARRALHEWLPEDLKKREQVLADLVMASLEAELKAVRARQGDEASVRVLLLSAEVWQGDSRWQDLSRSLGGAPKSANAFGTVGP